VKTSVANRQPTMKMITGMFAFSICMKETVKYMKDMLPKNSAAADNAPTGRQIFAQVFQLSCCFATMPDLTATAPTTAETAMCQQVRLTGKGKRMGCNNHLFDKMTPLLRDNQTMSLAVLRSSWVNQGFSSCSVRPLFMSAWELVTTPLGFAGEASVEQLQQWTLDTAKNNTSWRQQTSRGNAQSWHSNS